MTYEEALNLTKDSTLKGYILPEQKDYSYMYRVGEALERRIPNTAIIETIHRDAQINAFKYACPVCRNTLLFKGQKYCMCCGQAIEW